MANRPLYFDTPSGMLHVCMPEDVSHAIHIQSASEQILYWVEDDVLFREDILMQMPDPLGMFVFKKTKTGFCWVFSLVPNLSGFQTGETELDRAIACAVIHLLREQKYKRDNTYESLREMSSRYDVNIASGIRTPAWSSNGLKILAQREKQPTFTLQSIGKSTTGGIF